MSSNHAEIIIPPDNDAIYHIKNHPQRNRNLQVIKTFGRIQRVRNYAELAILVAIFDNNVMTNTMGD